MGLIHEYIEAIALGFEVVGVAIMVIGFALAVYRAFTDKSRTPYTSLRQIVGKSILLGLEVLVAADIILTVTTEPTVERLLALGLVVLIRTFLSFSLEVELEGRWPWRSGGDADADGVHEVMGE